MKHIWLTFLLALALPLAALAQDAPPAETPAEPPAAPVVDEAIDMSKYSKFSSSDFGFSVLLPKSGRIAKPGDPDWAEDDEIAFSWYGADSDPVVLIQGRVDEFESTLDVDTFDAFCAELHSLWSEDAEKFAVLTDTDIPMGSRSWNLLQIEDTANPEGRVFYSVFSAYVGARIYTITLYYLKPVDAEVQNFGKPVLQGFSVP